MRILFKYSLLKMLCQYSSIVYIMENKIKEIKSKLAIKIKLERTKRAWSQEKLAEIAKLSTTYINSIEHCANSPTIDTLIKIASAFGMEVVELIDVKKFDI